MIFRGDLKLICNLLSELLNIGNNKMNKVIYWFIAGTLLLISQNILSQKNENIIDINNLKESLNYIASDELEGRYAGSPGIEKAAHYIEDKLASYGVKPFPGLKDYEQKLNLYAFNYNPENTRINISYESGNDVYSLDSFAFLTPQYFDTVISGDVVFIGYGYKDDESGYNDLEGLDIKDKTVLMMSGTPNSEVTHEASNIGFDSETEGRKIENILQKGAKTILFVTSPSTREKVNYDIKLLSSIVGSGMQLDSIAPVSANFQMIAITENMADRIIQKNGYANLKELENKIFEQNKPFSFNLKSTKISVHVDVDRKIYADRNIIGYIEGRDPKLKHEYVVYCAHYDHDGTDSQGNVFNGADDNGSGTTGILEIARACSQLDKKPGRSMLFIWFTGEERGLLGSKFYADHPPVSFEKVVACMNMDMIGRTKLPSDTIPTLGYGIISVKENDTIYIISGEQSKQLIKLNEKSCANFNIVPDYSLNSFLPYSDQYNFYINGVPVLFFHSGLHSDYHRPGDEADKINYAFMQRICNVAFTTGYNVANRKRRIKVKD